MKIEYTCNGTYAGYTMKKGVQADINKLMADNMIETGRAKEVKFKKEKIFKTEKKDGES